MALLQVSRDVQRAPGVVTAQVAMATPLNVEVLGEMGFDVPAGATTNDMVVAIRLEPDGDLAQALAAVEGALAPARSSGADREAEPRRTTATALLDAPRDRPGVGPRRERVRRGDGRARRRAAT